MRKIQKFTLAELILISVVLLINAAVLLPVIAADGEASRHVACENNLKDVALKLHMYAEINDDYMPPAWSGASAQVRNIYGRKGGFWCDFLARDGYFTNWVEAKGSAEKAKTNAENAMKSLICPADENPVLLNHTYSIYTSYGFNQAYAKDAASIVKLSAITNADRAPMVMDSWGDTSGTLPVHMRARVSSGYLQSGRYPAHGFNNTAFFDGHVEALRNKKHPFTINF